MRIGIIGCGAWGVTIGKVFKDNGAEVKIWCHNQEYADLIAQKRIHPVLDGVKLPELETTVDLPTVVGNSDLLVLAIASNFIDILDEVKKYRLNSTPILVLTKGLLENKSTIFVSEYIRQILGQDLSLAVLSGPNIAIEIAKELPAATVIASKDEAAAQKIQKAISNNYFRAYRSLDIVGVELGGILKNIMAIAAGCIDALNLGTNAKSALMTRALREMIRFGLCYNAQSETFFGLSGVGDLITTCSSPNSRNWQAGYKIAKQDFEFLKHDKTQIAEGIKACKIVHYIAIEKNIDMPITKEIYQVIYEQKNPVKAISDLMMRDLKIEA
ncbi:MAG: NAD(P)H-dependent glycerol-3-phosphate dehydrogenase [Candidatus Margulisiibacteriota bacterium]|jgi:glycerol-3-phosphate dehydrogenase (NAD(P)+)